MINEIDIKEVNNRKTGRPKKAVRDSQTNDADAAPKSFAEVAAKYIGSIKDGLPTDLSANKEYLKDLGKKSAERRALQTRNKNLK
jgi:hypothetical protein